MNWLSAIVVLFNVTIASALALDMEDVVKRAAQLGAQPFENRPPNVPVWLQQLSYDQWREISFREQHALLKDSQGMFQVQFFHPGLFYGRSVAIYLLDATGIRQLEFSPSQFDYGRNKSADRIPLDVGYAGFRIHYPINTPRYRDEVIVFLGASYFRALGEGNMWGISARGIAIDTGLPTPEEFPSFVQFWLVPPPQTAKEMTVYALLDGPSITGAYRFVIRPGKQTKVDVEKRLFFRRSVNKLGIAPLTSMFFHGKNTSRKFDDPRPEVHDSDSLFINLDTGEWLQRPLDNPATVNVSAFEVLNPRGFGLLQTERDPQRYRDLESRSELRPNLWVSTKGDWGRGRVELIELPTDSEFHDNIVAFWVPDSLPQAGDSLSYAYTLWWYGDASPMGADPLTRPKLRVVEPVHGGDAVSETRRPDAPCPSFRHDVW